MLQKVSQVLSGMGKHATAHRCSPYLVFCAESMTQLQTDLCEHTEAFDVGEIKWGRFADGTPQIFIQAVHDIAGRDVVFLADFKATNDIFSQLSLLIMMQHYCARSLTVVLPFYPTATMERVDQEGQVATAFTLAKLISATPTGYSGPTRVVIFDIHTLGNRFYFSDSVTPVLETAVPLLLVSMLDEAEAQGTEPTAPTEVVASPPAVTSPSRGPQGPQGAPSTAPALMDGTFDLVTSATACSMPTGALWNKARDRVGGLASPAHNTTAVAAAIGAQPAARAYGIAFPDEGARKRFGGLFSSYPVIVCSKVRQGNERIVTVSDGDPKDLHVVIVDDLVQTGGTLIACKRALMEAGAMDVSAFVTHAIFPNQSYKKFFDAGFRKFWVTNSVPDVAKELEGKAPFEVLSLAPLVRETLWRLSPERAYHTP